MSRKEVKDLLSKKHESILASKNPTPLKLNSLKVKSMIFHQKRKTMKLKAKIPEMF